jgi:flagellar motor switch protein FliG
MNETGTIHDAAAIFSALRGDLVIELLSRLETEDAQRLLATASKKTPTVFELDQASKRLGADLQHANSQLQTDSVQVQPDLGNASWKKPQRSRKQQKQTGKPKSKHSLEFLIDWPNRDVQRLLSKVSTACWAPALHNESSLVLDAVFDRVAPAVERLLRQEIDAFDGNPKVARLSRQKIIAAAKELRLSEPNADRQKAA